MRLKPILMAGVTTLALSGLSFTGVEAAQKTQQDQANAQSQEHLTNQQGTQNGKIDLVTWSQRDFYNNGWTAQQLFDKDVYGENGDQAGDVDNLLIGANGQIQSVIVDSGGFLGIGDTDYAVPWNKVKFSDHMQRLTVPVTSDNISKFSVFHPDQQNGNQRNGKREFRATELMGDYVSLKDVPGYGIVRDLVFNDNAKLQAVVISPDVANGVGGPYAYPYYGYGYGWRPGANYYNLPYSQNEISKLGPFDYNKLPYGPPSQETMQQQNQKQQG
jgi:sporulation protein YlmC with PRC-barrel domain